jgi:hypothetical protein
MKKGMRTSWGVLLVLMAVSACRREQPVSPEQAYVAFIDAIQKGNSHKAWVQLSKQTQQKVEARSKEIAAASKGIVRDEPELLLFQGSRPGPIGEVTQVRADDSTALLKVASVTGTREVKLVKDSGRWLIDLSDTFEGRGSP